MSEDAVEPGPGRLRASDADREQVARMLTDGMNDGRLTPAELQERLDAVYRARTLGELEPLTRDLPDHRPLGASMLPAGASTGHGVSVRSAQSGPVVGGVGTSSGAVAIFGAARRRGEWVVPAQFTAVAVMGAVELDLTQATFAAQRVCITAVAIMGAVDITVPAGVRVEVSGAGIMGAFEDDMADQPAAGPSTPVLRVNGAAIMGGVRVTRSEAGPKQLPGDGRPQLRKG